MNQSFFHPNFFHSASAIFEPQLYIVVEQFGAENISLLNGRLVYMLLKHLFQRARNGIKRHKNSRDQS